MNYRRIIFLFLGLFLLSGCGQEAVSSIPSAAEATMNPLEAAALGIEDTEPVETEISWEKIDLMDENYGYILSETDFSTLDCDFSLYETTLFLESEQEADRIPLVRQAVDGSELERIWLPRPQDEMSDYTGAVILSDCVWAVRRDKTIVDQETGGWTAAFTLEQWDKSEQLLRTVPIDENFCAHPEDVFYAALQLSPQGDLLVGLDEGLYRLDDSGTVTGFLDYQGKSYSTCHDREGTLYLEDGSDVFPIDWDSFTLGQALFSIRTSGLATPGSGPYDFFLLGRTALKGVNIQAGTISTILNWSDWSLTTPANVIYLDENTLLVSVYGVFSEGYRYITMERVPISEIPTKTTIQLAVGVDKRLAESGIRWQDCTDLEELVSDFNLTNGTYEIQVSPFTTPSDLNLLMLEDDPPDIIFWSDSDQVTLKYSYMKKGYLADLTDYFQQDPDLTLDQFFPQLVEAATASDGSIYSMPSAWEISTMMGRQDLTGTTAGWSFEEFFAAADTLPVDTALQYSTASWGLYGLLSYTLNQFVDYQNLTCDFTGELFQSLLAFCKTHYYQNSDQIPETSDMLTDLMSGNLMLLEPAIFHPAFFAEQLPDYLAAGLFLVGHPGIGGSGVAGIPKNEFSITTLSDQAEGAWAFLKKIYSSNYQGSFHGGGSGSVRPACLESASRNCIVAFSMDVDEDTLQTVFDLYTGAVAVTPSEPDLLDIIQEEAQAFFDGDKTAMEVGEILNNRISIYLSEQN